MPATRSLAAALMLALLSACSAPSAHYSGTVQTEASSVGSQLGGRVLSVAVAAGSRVRRGEIVLRLDSAILQAELDQARGQADAARANLAALQRGPVETEVARANAMRRSALATYQQSETAGPQRIQSARAAERLARATYERMRSLVLTGDVSRAAYDQARAAYVQAQAQLVQVERAEVPGEQGATLGNAQAASEAYRTLANGTRPEEIAQAQAQVRNADASVARARARVAETEIRAPVDGVVASFNLHPGDMLAPNQTAAVIDALSNPYVYIYASQRDLERLRSAQRLRVHPDSGSGTFDARVESFDRSAQFTPQNVETADQRAQLVYGLKLRIDDPKHTLLDGTTVTVDVP